MIDIHTIWTCKGPPRIFPRCLLTGKCFVWLFSDPPSITYIMNDTTFNENDRVTLNCQADGNPPPTIRWIFVNDSSYVPGLFYITGKQNEGFYKCIAENSVGRDESSRDVYLTVFCKSYLNLAAVVSWDRVIKYMVVLLVISSISVTKQRQTSVFSSEKSSLCYICTSLSPERFAFFKKKAGSNFLNWRIPWKICLIWCLTKICPSPRQNDGASEDW